MRVFCVHIISILSLFIIFVVSLLCVCVRPLLLRHSMNFYLFAGSTRNLWIASVAMSSPLSFEHITHVRRCGGHNRQYHHHSLVPCVGRRSDFIHTIANDEYDFIVCYSSSSYCSTLIGATHSIELNTHNRRVYYT